MKRREIKPLFPYGQDAHLERVCKRYWFLLCLLLSNHTSGLVLSLTPMSIHDNRHNAEFPFTADEERPAAGRRGSLLCSRWQRPPRPPGRAAVPRPPDSSSPWASSVSSSPRGSGDPLARCRHRCAVVAQLWASTGYWSITLLYRRRKTEVENILPKQNSGAS